jgi:hypothetical protein
MQKKILTRSREISTARRAVRVRRQRPAMREILKALITQGTS